MELIERIVYLAEQMAKDTKKVYRKGNKSASIRARRNANEMRLLMPKFRKEILEEIKKKHDI